MVRETSSAPPSSSCKNFYLFKLFVKKKIYNRLSWSRSSWRWVVKLHAPSAAPQEWTTVPNYLHTGWAPEPVWTFWIRENVFASDGIRTPDRIARPYFLYLLFFRVSEDLRIRTWNYVPSNCDSERHPGEPLRRLSWRSWQFFPANNKTECLIIGHDCVEVHVKLHTRNFSLSLTLQEIRCFDFDG
jgi:hypothetical protein